MRISFEEAERDDLLGWIREYTCSVGLVDTYWLNQIWDGVLRKIRIDGVVAGFFAMLGNALTGFYLRDPSCSMEVFRRLLRDFHPELAYIVTNDEPFLTLALDHASRTEAHGYFFRDLRISPSPPAYPIEQIRPAAESDLPDLIATGFYHPAALDPENPIYVLRDSSGNFLGTGHIALWMRRAGRDWGAVGMYTAPAHRGKGVGRSLILAMKEYTCRMGLTPIAGCYHDNLASKATLESCGFRPSARYLKLFF